MAIIYSYPVASAVEAGDLLIGTDITGKQTKNFSIGSIVAAGIPSYIVGTINTIPVFTGSNTIGDSIITQDSGANGVGIGGDAENNRKLKVHGNSSVDGNLYLSGASSAYSIEVGQSRTTEGVAVLDLTGEIIPDDYGLRLIRYGGENAESAIIHTGTSNLRIRTENSADTVFENTKVGIGIAAPQRELDVNGGIRVRGPLDLFQQNDNTFAGTNAGNFYNVVGNSNTAFGEDALAAITTASINTAVGLKALKENISGNNNTGIGNSALEKITIGSNNTVVGDRALQLVVDGQSNTAIGQEALLNQTTGDFNVSVGRRSGESVTTGFKNTFLGQKAGTSVTTGQNNIYIGNESAYTENTTNSIVIGAEAVGNGSNTTTLGNDDITLTEIKGNVKIGTNNTLSGSRNLSVGFNNRMSGNNSIAAGLNNLATGENSVSFGNSSNVSGNNSIGSGFNTESSGTNSLATGLETTASGNQSVAFGDNNTASGVNSTATGLSNVVAGNNSLVTGNLNSVSGTNSFAAGQGNAASGLRSMVLGFGSKSLGDNSVSIGFENEANTENGICIGKSNNDQSTGDDPNFLFGQGNSTDLPATQGNVLIGRDNSITSATHGDMEHNVLIGRALNGYNALDNANKSNSVGSAQAFVAIGVNNALPSQTAYPTSIVLASGRPGTSQGNAYNAIEITEKLTATGDPSYIIIGDDIQDLQDDAEAASEGVPIRGIYKTGNDLKIRTGSGVTSPDIVTATNITASAGQNLWLSADDAVNLSKISWSGGNGTFTLRLPPASSTTANSIIRFITDGTFGVGAGDKVLISARPSQTIDGAQDFELNKAYEGVTVWTDGTEWFVIQAKA
jgi:hypothetical protein